MINVLFTYLFIMTVGAAISECIHAAVNHYARLTLWLLLPLWLIVYIIVARFRIKKILIPVFENLFKS